MSANNQIVLNKEKRKWIVTHFDVDTGRAHEEIGSYPDLEEAVKAANKFEEELNEQGVGLEYGLRIVFKE